MRYYVVVILGIFIACFAALSDSSFSVILMCTGICILYYWFSLLYSIASIEFSKSVYITQSLPFFLYSSTHFCSLLCYFRFFLVLYFLVVMPGVHFSFITKNTLLTNHGGCSVWFSTLFLPAPPCIFVPIFLVHSRMFSCSFTPFLILIISVIQCA